MEKEYKVGVVIVAAGSGLRFGERKQFKKLKSKPLYLYSLEKFAATDLVSEIALVVPTDLKSAVAVDVQKISKNIKVVKGGKLRQDSVLSGVNALSSDCALVCVHDAARPFITDHIISKAIESCKEFDGCVVAIPSSDTVKEVHKNSNRIKRTIPRDTVWLAQTPQVFHREKLLPALAYANTDGITVTDEAMLLESLDSSIAVVEGNTNNFKITTKEDWELAELILEKSNG